MAEKYLLFSLEDEKAKKLGEVIASSTCKKIVNFLSEQEASETEISNKLNLPLNTIEYNLNKLLESGLIEKSKNYFWSSKGKRIETYKVANKLIVISPKKANIYAKIKNVIPAILITGILTAFLALYYKSSYLVNRVAEKAATSEAGGQVLSAVPESVTQNAVSSASFLMSNPWLWFGLGSLAAIIIFLLWNWKRL